MPQTLHLIGSAYGFGAGNVGCGDGPDFLKDYLNNHPALDLPADWKAIIKADHPGDTPLATIATLNRDIAQASHTLIRQQHFPINIGGDHSCAIGMWSGIATALRDKGDIGLIWIDAHLDAHTPDTTPTGNIHGMPVAALLGYGEHSLTSIGDDAPKLKPENLVFLGARSYESGEHELLQSLGVKIFYMDDIEAHGFNACFAEAVEIASKQTIGYGLSFDLDGVDPSEAPGVGTPVDNGLSATDVLSTFKHTNFKDLLGLEIVEFNPHLDQEHLTLQLLIDTMKIVTNS